MRLSASYFPSRAEGLVLHSGLVQTILTTLVAILITWAVTAFLQRKRVAWRDYLDAPVNLDPKEASRVSSWKILCEDKEVTDPVPGPAAHPECRNCRYQRRRLHFHPRVQLPRPPDTGLGRH
jgi:hypothetical protein